ncbi:putative gibberellin 20-oxidase [Karstenula rhodostoma CBS 690.94]|uniref:Gibberellin 20-oxidase n=1 Tax=Karstenula rhodostoma CBS 690.94 TaxID=1392251 RepID=A0A9P4PV94_9PLEO|nr:putative gibberellin 20-oxidase [Karstenula rhodostoma CBS 690.94]
MSTTFSSLPVVDVHILKASESTILNTAGHQELGEKLYDAFATVGFAYLIDAPLGFTQDELFELSREFFALPLNQKMKLAKKSFRPSHVNTYRGYFPTQPHLTPDNFKEGFEIGNPTTDHNKRCSTRAQRINLAEPNIWPDAQLFSKQERLEHIYNELQNLAANLLSLLAAPLGKDPEFFSSWLDNSLSTLRLLHYPPVTQATEQGSEQGEHAVRLSCPPHTDSGVLTLLHQDATGGLEVLNAAGEWIQAPYIPGSIVVNVGDLMARVSGSRLKATKHRVRAPPPNPDAADAFGLSVDGEEGSVVYGDFVRKKMATFVEFREESGYETGTTEEM